MGEFDRVFSEMAGQLAEQVTARVLASLEPKIAAILVEASDICFSEEEAATKLKISEEKLARLRKAKLIGCSYSIPPTRFDRDRRPTNGRPVYMRHHLLTYLLRHELQPLSSGKAEVAFENVYHLNARRNAA